MRMAMARLPGAILTSRPAPLPWGARRPATNASPVNTATRVTRPTSESTTVTAPAGTAATGHSFTASIVLSMFAPSGRSFAATTTRLVGTRLCSLVVWSTR
jgi:hypothetical protein